MQDTRNLQQKKGRARDNVKIIYRRFAIQLFLVQLFYPLPHEEIPLFRI